MNASVRKSINAERFVSDMIRNRGMMVEVDGDIGTIAGMNSSANLDVVFANKLKYGNGTSNCHPYWRVKYFEANGNIIAHHNGNQWLLKPGGRERKNHDAE